MLDKKVFVTRIIPQEGLDLLKKEIKYVEIADNDEVLPYNTLKEVVCDIDGLLCQLTDKIDENILNNANHLCGISNYAVGYNNIDIDLASKKGIKVTNTPDVLTNATADLSWALLFAVARRMNEAEKYVRERKWKGWGPLQFLGKEITNQTLGIIGAGRIGTAMALKSAGFNMNVLYYSNSKNDILEEKVNAKKVELDQLLSESDFVSLHVPLTNKTKHMITYDQLKLMKKTAFIINTSRGAVIKESDLARSLRDKQIAGAGLDVYEFEPEIDEKLFDYDNVVLLPHIGSATTSTRSKMAIMAAESLVTILKGEIPSNIVNNDVISS